ncbi:MAG: hypothetical protein M1379_16655 [Firmicutes bacterium]|nr:hypothetical protein [Bacillota bacterium]
MKKGLTLVAVSVSFLINMVLWNVSNARANEGQPLFRGIHPVVNSCHRLLGGIVDGRWLNQEEMAKLLNGEEIYKFYSQTKEIGEARGSKAKKEVYISGEQGYFLNFGLLLPEEAFGISAEWNPLPRVPRVYTNQLDLASFLPLVKSLLDREDRNVDGLYVKEALTVDLEGDGQLETIIVSTNIRDKDIEAISKERSILASGFFSSVVLFRNGASDAFFLADDSKLVSYYSVPFVSDVDGDGIMEVYIVKTSLIAIPTFGFALMDEQILKVEGNQIKMMLRMFTNRT